MKDIVWLRILEMCGISAAITTLLHAPLTGAIFSLELVFGCKFVYRLLTISLLSSLIAFILSDYIMAAESLFTLVQHDTSYTLFEYFIVLLSLSLLAYLVVLACFLSSPSFVEFYTGLPVLAHAPVGALICASRLQY